MRVYLAGPLFSEAERAWLDGFAARLRAEGIDCFVPHEQFGELKELTPSEVFRVDAEGVRAANVLVAWLDGPVVDDGTACEIGMFAQLVASGDPAAIAASWASSPTCASSAGAATRSVTG